MKQKEKKIWGPLSLTRVLSKVSILLPFGIQGGSTSVTDRRKEDYIVFTTRVQRYWSICSISPYFLTVAFLTWVQPPPPLSLPVQYSCLSLWWEVPGREGEGGRGGRNLFAIAIDRICGYVYLFWKGACKNVMLFTASCNFQSINRNVPVLYVATFFMSK